MKILRHIFPSVLFVGLLLALAFWILWTSLGFQQCVETYGDNYPSAEHLKEGGSRIISNVLMWRHCAGVYALDNNAIVNAIGTVVIAIFTTILAVFTVRLAGSTRIAADAANLNAEAVIAAERAYIFVEIRDEQVMLVIKQMSGLEQPPFTIAIDYRFTNEGKTPAIIRAISYGVTVAENLPSEREYSPILHLPTHLLGAGKSTKSLEYNEFKMTTAIADSIVDLKATFWFYGNIVYDDMFGRQKTLNFVFHASGISEGFTLYRYDETDEKRDS
ncbi:hypothetical protein [Bradyrhizobium sp.]